MDQPGDREMVSDPSGKMAKVASGLAGEPHVLDLWCASLLPLVILVFGRFCAILQWWTGFSSKASTWVTSFSDSSFGLSRNQGRKSFGNSKSFHFWMLLLICQATIRIGEASNPGPPGQGFSWTVGTCNPTGLTSKYDIVASLEGDFWGMTETHLSQVGVRHLKTALQCQQSSFKYFVPGAPCTVRSNSETVGNFTGVAALSKWPTRALPHDLDPSWYQSSRVQIVGTCIASLWIQIGIVYGFPYSNTHRFPKYQTDQLLEGLVDRIGLQTTGPRIIMGDFNWPAHELDQVRRLRHLGFRELQQIACDWWGREILPTGHSRQIDFVFISPELVPLLQDVIVDPSQRSDHASVQGVFAGQPADLERFHWNMPHPVEWPRLEQPIQIGQIDNPTDSYARLWHTAERVASDHLQLQGKPPLRAAQSGRAQTMTTVRIVPYTCPIRKSRSNEVQPGFSGISCRYAQQFKQLRRLQSLVRTMRKNPFHPNINILWTAIRNSTGFPGGFCHWWHSTGVLFQGGPKWLSVVVPTLADCEQLFCSVQHWVESFGKELKQSRTRIAKRRRHMDLHYLFQDCSRDPPKQVDVLVQTTSAQVISVDTQANTLEVDRPSPFQVSVPIVVSGNAMSILDQYENEIAVEALAPVDLGATVRQTKVVTQVSAVLEAFREEWEPRWARLDHLHDSQWTQIIQFAKVSLEPIQWSFPSITRAQFERAVAAKKKTAAVGPDGISRLDLMKLAPTIGPGSLALYQHAETTGVWPKQLTMGVVSLLEKSKNALDVRQYRPVVVYPLTYRTWSSIRGKQFLRALGAQRPSGMRGGMPKCQAKSVWYEMAILLESSHASGESLIGVVADLEKAFNCIPRLPIWTALHTMQCPDSIIRGWGGFVNAQTRSFKVRGSLGAPIQSTSGYPEGCALSVGAMAIIDILLDNWMTSMFPKLRCLTYIDDWQLVHEHIHRHPDVVARLNAFVDAVAMKLDSKKTYVWATQSTERSELRQGTFAVVPNARSLGAHMTYTKQKGNRTLVERINDMDHTWKLLKASVAPYFRKLQALCQLAWPRALHAVSGSPLARSHFSRLRTGAVRGLKAHRVGTSPMLHLVSQGFLHDPEVWALWQTIKDARDFGDPTLFLSNLSMCAGDKKALPTNGPTAILIGRLEHLGWNILPTGFLEDDIGSFNVLECPIDVLRFRIMVSLPMLLAKEVAHRQCFDGLHQVDIGETHRLVSSFSSADRVFFVCSLDGTMYTRKGYQHWNESFDNQCPFCQGEDGFYHRLWQCPHFSPQRDNIPQDLRPLIDSFPGCCNCHGWPIRPPSQWKFLQILDAIEDVPTSSYVLSGCHGPVVDLFTDGTCLMPENPSLRLAAWAICVAQPWINEWNQEVVASGWVPGLQQTAFRAELLSMVHATRIAMLLPQDIRVWSDCLSLVCCIRRIQLGDFHYGPNMAHGDLWQELLATVEILGNRFQVFHVFSHIVPSLGGTIAEQWVFWHNGLVDLAAARANTIRGRCFWALWSCLAWEQHQYRRCFEAIATLIVQTGRRAERDTITPAMPAPTPDTVVSTEAAPLRTVAALPELVVQKYGYAAVQWMHSWWQSTGERFLKHPGELRWISFLQLFVDYAMTTGQEGPLLHDGRWFFGFRTYPGDVMPNFSLQSKWFQMMVKRYWDGNKLPVRIRSMRPHSTAIVCWAVCALLPWEPSRLSLIDQTIRENFGGIIKKCLSIRDLTRVVQHAPWAIDPPDVGFRG